MPSDRVGPLAAFAVVSVVCALVVVANMARHPHATVTTVEAARVAHLGPEVRFGSVLAPRPRDVPLTGNVLSIALDAPVTTALRSQRSRTAPVAAPTGRAARPAHPAARRSPAHAPRHPPRRAPAHRPPPAHAPRPPGHAAPGHAAPSHAAPGHAAPGHSGQAPGHRRGHGHTQAPGHSGSRGYVEQAPRQLRGHAKGRDLSHGSAGHARHSDAAAPGRSGMAPGHLKHRDRAGHGHGRGVGPR